MVSGDLISHQWNIDLDSFVATLIIGIISIIINFIIWYTYYNRSKSRQQTSDRSQLPPQKRNHLSRKHHSVLDGVETIVTEHVDEYRKALKYYGKTSDNVLEAGCHCGTTTNIAAKICNKGNVVGIDQSQFQLNNANKQYSHITNMKFYQIDAFNISKIIEIGIKFDIILIDISGSRDLKSLLQLIESYEKALKPRLMIVKSIKLAKLLNQTTLWRHSC